MKKIEGKVGRGLSIRYKLLLSYILVIIIPVVIGAYLPFIYTRDEIIKETNQSLSFSLDQMVESMKYKMAKYIRISNKLVNDYELMNYLADDYTGREKEAHYAAYAIYNKKLSDEIQSNYEEILNIRIYKKNHTLPADGGYLIDEDTVKDEYWYESAYKNKGVAFWKRGTYKTFEKKDINTISIINGIRQPNSVGLLEIELKTEDFFNVIRKFKYKQDCVIGIIDETGKTVTQNSNELYDELLPMLENRITELKNDSFTQKINNDDYLVIVKQLNYQGWKLFLSVPLDELYQSTNMIKFVTFITVISCIIVFIFITIFLANIMTSRLQKLAKRMRSVEVGNFDVFMAVKGNDEISELGRVFNSMVESIRNLIDEVYKNKIEKKEAELRALQEQINPHFLYNTLSSINWLAVQAGAPKIINIVEALAMFYRLTLNKGNEMIPLKDEFTQAKAYVTIQKIRYEDNFEVFFEMDKSIEDIKIIKLIIQPFIENAIIHGFSEKSKGSIYINAKAMGENLLIRIIDNGKGMEQEKADNLLKYDGTTNQKGYGIKNVNERIKIHYGEKYGISITSEFECGTVVELLLPANNEHKEEPKC